jgi:3-isopropylmalate dehydrogenase
MSRIAIIPGDGIGVDVTREAVKVLECVGGGDLRLDLVHWDLGAQRYLETGVTITADEMEELRDDYDAIFLGAMGDPRVPTTVHARDILLGMRFQLDLYINLRPVQLFDSGMSPLRDVAPEDVDMVIFRENTEGVYVGMGGTLQDGHAGRGRHRGGHQHAQGRGAHHPSGVRARPPHGRRRVTLSDKANAMPHAGGLWRRTFAEVGAEYADVERNAVYADALALDLVLNPSRYDVIVAPNLFGDILSDLAAALVGGLGLAPSASLHPGRIGLFEPVHGSAPDLVGTGRANPLAAILTAALMLRFLGHTRAMPPCRGSVRGQCGSATHARPGRHARHRRRGRLDPRGDQLPARKKIGACITDGQRDYQRKGGLFGQALVSLGLVSPENDAKGGAGTGQDETK